MPWSTSDMDYSDRIRAYKPSKADSVFRAMQQREAVRRMWTIIGSVVAFLLVVRVLRLAFSILFGRRLFYPEEPNLAIEKVEKVSSPESVLPGRNSKASWRRFPAAFASGFRIIVFRVQVPLLVGVASVAELFFIFGYIAAMLSLAFTNSTPSFYPRMCAMLTLSRAN